MKQFLFIFIFLVGAMIIPEFASSMVKLPKTGQDFCYNTLVSSTGGLTTCFQTGQDGDLQSGFAWPSTRFAVNLDQTVTDLLTGLVWSGNANPSGTLTTTWQGALDYITTLNNQNYLGYSDWRLPNRKELMSLVNWGQASPAGWLNSQGFSNDSVKPSYYWSSSSNANPQFPNSVWKVYFGDGNQNVYLKTGTGYVWPVRGGEYWTVDSVMLVPGTTDLGTRIGGSSAGLQTVMLRNTGATDATFTSIGFTGADAADFAVTVTPGDPSACASLTPVMTAGTSCTLTVSAQPALIGLTSKSANLSFITSNGSSQDIPYSMNVSYSMLLGTVTDQTTGLPISGATVALGGSAQSVVTDSTGTFKFGPLLDGTYSITASLTGYLDNTVNTIAVSTSQSGIAPVSLTPGYILTAYVAGTGTGTVTSDPGGISCAGNGTGTAVTCPYGFSGSVALHATVTGTSMFGGWGGLHCSGLASTCTVTMSGPTDVTATFNQAPLVSIGGKEYLSLQAAYDAAVDNDIIQLLQNTVTGTLNANRIVSVTIEGGYSGFSDAPGVTTVKAPLVISKGRAALQRIVIKK